MDPGGALILAIAVAAALVAWALLANWLLRVSPRGEIARGAVLILLRLYARVFHRLRIVDAHHAPRTGRDAGPLLVVCNHTAGVDPLLVQAACRFEIRWIMAQDMRIPALEPMWRWVRVIFVERDGGSAIAMRDALRELERGGVVGLFPEGRIERARGELGQFRAGVGVLIARSRAPVLPCVIEGAPKADTAWASLWRTSRASIRFLPIQRDLATAVGRKPERIAEELRQRYAAWTGWSLAGAPNAPQASGVIREAG